METLIKEVFLPWKVMIALCVLTFLIGGVQSCTAGVVRDGAVIAPKVACTVASFNRDGEVKLTCPATGNKVMHNQSFALDYALKPRPLTCKLYSGFEPDCTFAK